MEKTSKIWASKVENLQEQVKRLKHEKENMRTKNALLRQRPDLPVERTRIGLSLLERAEKAEARVVELEHELKQQENAWIKESHRDGFALIMAGRISDVLAESKGK